MGWRRKRWKVVKTYLLPIALFDISISISISIRQFCKISISIRYRIDSNLAYRTGLHHHRSIGKVPLESLKKGVNGLVCQDLGDDWVSGHAGHKLSLGQLVVLVLVSSLEHLGHHGGHVDLARVGANLNEERHHVEELVNADGAVAVLVEEIEDAEP